MNVHRIQHGQGPDVVLLHGWGTHAGVWGSLPATLAARFRVTAVDLPGYGGSRTPRGPYTLEALADAVLDAVPGPAVWVGWSLGAMTTLTAAARAPARVCGAVLIGATPKFVRTPDWPCALAAEVLAQFATDLVDDYRATLLRFLSLQIGGREAARPLVQALRTAMFARGDPDRATLAAGLAILRDADVRPLLPEVSCPVQIVHGSRDRLVPLAAARALEVRLPQARLATIERAGHAPFLSHPAMFAEVLVDYLDGRS